jgi:hypothetical protein
VRHRGGGGFGFARKAFVHAIEQHLCTYPVPRWRDPSRDGMKDIPHLSQSLRLLALPGMAASRSLRATAAAWHSEEQ